jgi:trans-aconitate methyltransferase
MPTQRWNAALYDQKHSFVYGYGKDIVSLLAPQPGELILDLGCGTGPLTREIADAGARVVGIDGSPEMIDKARQQYPGLEFQAGDARTFSFPYTFDAVFSNAVLHWVPDAGAVAARIALALKPGGRFVAEFGGKGNIAAIATATCQAVAELLDIRTEHSWYFPSSGEYAIVLEQHGLEVQSASLFDRPTRLDGENGLRNWFAMFGVPLLHDVPEDQRLRIIAAVEGRLRGELYRDGQWYADYRRLRVVAIRLP